MLQAALIQLLVIAPVIGCAHVLARWEHPLSPSSAALVQGVFAALLTWIWALAPWWRAIQLLFPIALVEASALHLPPVLWSGIFLALLLVFWSTFRTQVPFFPSGPAAWAAVAALVPADRPVRFVDIGSGLGGLVLDLARRRPGCEVFGIETAPLPWLMSVLRARMTRSPVRFVRGDYEQLDFADFDVVFAYLSPAAMSALWRKAEHEMRPGTLLLSYEFTIPEREPDRTVTATPSTRAIFIWCF